MISINKDKCNTFYKEIQQNSMLILFFLHFFFIFYVFKKFTQWTQKMRINKLKNIVKLQFINIQSIYIIKKITNARKIFEKFLKEFFV